jgi:potassium efflux system protein
MRNLFKGISLGFIAVSLFGTAYNSNAQKVDTQKIVKQAQALANKKANPLSYRDSVRREMRRRNAMIRSFKNTDGSANVLLSKIEEYTNTYIQIKSDLSRGFDTLDVSEELPQMERRMSQMRITIDRSTTLNYLSTIRDMIDHSSDQLKEWQAQLTAYNNQLDTIRENIADFKADSLMHQTPADTDLRVKSYLQVKALETKWARLDSVSKKGIIKISDLENRVSALSLLVLDLDNQVDFRVHEFTLKAITNEYGFIWATRQTDRLDTTLVRSYNVNYRLYKYFLISKSNYLRHIACILLLVLFLVWILSSKRKIQRVKDDHQSIFDQTHYAIKHPLTSAVLVVSIIGTYFYDHPPQVFSQTTLIVTIAAIGILIKDIWPKPLFNFWKILFVLAILLSVSNVLILVTYTDRLLLLATACIGIYAAFKLVKYVRTSPTAFPLYLEIILKLFIGLLVVSILMNIVGRFSLAKIILAASVFNLCLGMGLYLLVQILMESLFLQLEGNKGIDNQTIASYLDFNVVQKKFKDVVINVCCVLWLIALAQNLEIDDYLYDQATDFLNNKYKFGNTGFTFGSVLIFFVVIWISGLIARVISYFYDVVGMQQTKLTPKAKKTRSSILLIRLTIFVIGFFVAITAAGIPMDRVTIIIGALGVGIGFGLQNIVNNLVSGIILAFEKPIQVGDIIQVSGKSGIIKEIGIRASKIDCGDGSELIVPNGDLISQHVVNWTLTDNSRRIELIVGVAYGSDVAKVEGILKDIVNNREDIMKSPKPLVFLHKFSESSVDFRLLFWSADIGMWLTLKSDVMSNIYSEFTKQGIEIPHPKRDIQVFFPEGTTAEDVGKLQVPTKNPLGKDQ